MRSETDASSQNINCQHFFNAFSYLPAITLVDVQNLEKSLKSTASRHLLVCTYMSVYLLIHQMEQLKQCGYSTIEDTTASILRVLFTNQCTTFTIMRGKILTNFLL